MDLFLHAQIMEAVAPAYGSPRGKHRRYLREMVLILSYSVTFTTLQSWRVSLLVANKEEQEKSFNQRIQSLTAFHLCD